MRAVKMMSSIIADRLATVKIQRSSLEKIPALVYIVFRLRVTDIHCINPKHTTRNRFITIQMLFPATCSITAVQGNGLVIFIQ